MLDEWDRCGTARSGTENVGEVVRKSEAAERVRRSLIRGGLKATAIAAAGGISSSLATDAGDVGS